MIEQATYIDIFRHAESESNAGAITLHPVTVRLTACGEQQARALSQSLTRSNRHKVLLLRHITVPEQRQRQPLSALKLPSTGSAPGRSLPTLILPALTG